MNILLKNRIALQSIKIWLSLAFFFITSMVFAATPAATDNLGLIGTAYYIGNVSGGTVGTFTGNNWNGTADLVTTNYSESPQSSGTDVYWKFDNVRIKLNGEFRFWVGRVWTTSLEYNDFNSRIFVPMGTSVGSNGQNLKINSTPSSLDTQYDIVVRRSNSGVFYIYFTYSRIGLNGNCYYKGNRTDAFKHTSITTDNLNWKASTDEGYEIEPEVVTASGTYPACKYTYTYTGVILNTFGGSQPGISFMVDNDGVAGGRLVASQSIGGSASSAFTQYNFGTSLGWPNQDVWKFQGTNDQMYTITWTLDYTGSSAPGNPNTITAQVPSDADWLAYRMGIMGGAYYIENDTNQVTTWIKNWSNARAKTTYDVAPVLSGTGNRYVTWTFNGVIMRNGEAFKLRHEQNWNGRNIGFNSTQSYSQPGNVRGSSTPITSSVGASFLIGSNQNITIANPSLSGVVQPNWIYKLSLQLDRTTGIYTFGVDKTTANWVGGDVTVGMTDNVVTGWRNPLNWDIDVVPMRSTDVVVDKKTYQPIITANASCNTLTIASTAGANVSVNANAVLDVRNIVNSVPSSGVGIILNNNVRKQAILYNYGTYTNAAGGGVIQVNTVLDSDTTYHFGHEVSGAAVLSDNYNAQTISVYRYNTTSNGWDLLANGDKLTTADRANSYENSPVTGYALRNKSGLTKTLSYSGVPASNSADISTVIPFNVSGAYSFYHGYYLIANPYTTYLNLEALYTAGGFGDANLEKTVWVPHRSKTDATTWEMYNFAGSVGVIGGRVSALTNRNIPPAQAFWVLSKATSSFTFKPSSRTIATGATQQSLKSLSTSSEPNDIFRFGSPSVGLKSQMALLFREIGTAELSSNDSHNFSGLDGIFSMKDGEEIAINLLPMLERDTIIDLGYRYSGSSVAPVVLEAQSLSSFFGSVPVFLEDRDKQMFYDLRETPQVTVYLASGFNSTRFALHFGAYSGLATSKPAITQPTSFIKFYQNNDVVSIAIVGSNDVKGVVQLISVAGEVISTTPINSSTLDVQLPASNMFYIVRVISNVGIKSEKFMAR